MLYPGRFLSITVRDGTKIVNAEVLGEIKSSGLGCPEDDLIYFPGLLKEPRTVGRRLECRELTFLDFLPGSESFLKGDNGENIELL